MVRNVLLLVLTVLIIRAISRALAGVVEGMSSKSQSSQWAGRGYRAQERGAVSRSVHRARDPVCGTYVIPDRAVPLSDAGGPLFFCSNDCREKYRARPADGRTA